METNSRETLQAAFDAFDISENLGFLLEEPLTTLPDYYRVWLDLANNLTHLIESRKLRDQVHKAGSSSTGVHHSWDMYGRKDNMHPLRSSQKPWLSPIGREMEIGNLDMIFSFPGGESCRGFFIVSLLVDMAASSGITGTLEMKETFKLMHNHVDPAEFHGTLRMFFSGWRDNPMLPRGLLYEGVSNEPILLSGISAAQSSTIQCFDALLRIQHEDETQAFLTRMRDYMLPAHRQLIQTLYVCPSLRDFILSHSSSDLCQAYNSCVSALVDLRNYHLNSVTKYIIVPGNRVRAIGCPLRGVGPALNNTGTGGSNIMGFLKSVRDTTRKTLILEVPI
ncbi:Indoleamine 2,3-dioxygenase 2 [Larimichthys crocea]|uniref:Indoleamine 2,3-dioxygenase 2 n=1 Tax=Larimichthys crocea TaxID=215358 RepID=A0A6G0HNT9_LARCR|nr:Indoleamine 2,3-dioxygenase 2 [Larimichthys crocea]